jgi:hypothetical protein
VSIAASTLWQLGYPDQAPKRGNQALALAQRLSHPFSLAFAKYFFGVLRQLRGTRSSRDHGGRDCTLCRTRVDGYVG